MMIHLNRHLTSFGSPLLTEASTRRTQSLARDPTSHPLGRQPIVLATAMLWALSVAAGLSLWWWFPIDRGVAMVRNVGLAAGVVAFSLAFIASLRPQWSPALAPLYAIAGGLFMAGLSRAFEARFPGIALPTVLVTLCVFGVTLTLYAARWLRATPRFQLVVYSATAGIALFYLLALLLALAGLPLAWLGENHWGAVLWYGFVSVTAALNLVLDFERIDSLQKQAQPDYVVWYAALGLMVTLVWLYISVLRLLASLRR